MHPVEMCGRNFKKFGETSPGMDPVESESKAGTVMSVRVWANRLLPPCLFVSAAYRGRRQGEMVVTLCVAP